MRQASPQLIALLNSGQQFIMADLYTLTLQGGGTYRYSSGTTALTAGGSVFSLGPRFDRTRTKTVVGTTVAELIVTVYPGLADTLPPLTAGAASWSQAAWQGQLDGATVQLDRVFMPTWGDTSAGTVILFAGRIGDIDIGRSAIELRVRSYLELLNIQMPRHTFQSTCTLVFGDAMCQFDRSSLATYAAAASGSTQSVIATSGFSPSPPNLYNLGTAIATAGANAGFQRSIGLVDTSGNITVKPPFLLPVVPGDLFRLLPGCDHTRASCLNNFNNLIHFGGFDQIPVAEVAL
jgi:uncharacterized phage protein (TIGR02218 family)